MHIMTKSILESYVSSKSPAKAITITDRATRSRENLEPGRVSEDIQSSGIVQGGRIHRTQSRSRMILGLRGKILL